MRVNEVGGGGMNATAEATCISTVQVCALGRRQKVSEKHSFEYMVECARNKLSIRAC